MTWPKITEWDGYKPVGMSVTPLRLSEEEILERFRVATIGPTVAKLIRDGQLSGGVTEKEEE